MNSPEVDAYIESFPEATRKILTKIRNTIRKAAPDAEEVISYRMPAFRQGGIVVYYAAWKHHIGLYPPVTGDQELEAAVARYAGPKGNLQFPIDEPMPLELIKRIVKLRLNQIAAKQAVKRKRK